MVRTRKTKCNQTQTFCLCFAAFSPSFRLCERMRMFNSLIKSCLNYLLSWVCISLPVSVVLHMDKIEECAVCARLRMCLSPHEVVIVEAIPSGWAVYVAPLRRDERVGLVRGHKQIWNHKTLLDKSPYLNQVRHAHRATDLSQVKLRGRGGYVSGG